MLFLCTKSCGFVKNHVKQRYNVKFLCMNSKEPKRNFTKEK